jgi:MFS family permease
VVGLGVGMVFGCAVNVATYGADPEDAGVASAMVNSTQQVGASIGVALLNTIAASATTGYLVVHGQSPQAHAKAIVHGHVVAFAVAAGVFVAATIVTALVLPWGVPEPVATQETPVKGEVTTSSPSYPPAEA